MKIKRPLINQFYEEGDQEPEEQIKEPLERPSFTHIKPLEQAKKEPDAATATPIKVESDTRESTEVVIQTKPSKEFLKWKAQEEERKQKEAEAEIRLKQEAELREKQRIEAEKKAKEEFEIRSKALEEEIRRKAEKEIERTKILAQQKELERQKQLQKEIPPALPKQAVRAEDMPQRRKILKKPAIVEESEAQLEFPITPKRVTLEQRLKFIKMYFERRQELLEISMLWKNPSLPFNIISVLFVVGLLFIGGIFEFDRIPLKIPLFYNHVEKSWEQADKSTVFIMGIVLLITEGLLINLLIKIFKSDRRLALTLSWVITFINVLIIIAALQIYSLIT